MYNIVLRLYNSIGGGGLSDENLFLLELYFRLVLEYDHVLIVVIMALSVIKEPNKFMSYTCNVPVDLDFYLLTGLLY